MHPKESRTTKAYPDHPMRRDMPALMLGATLTMALLVTSAVSVAHTATEGDPMTLVKNTVNHAVDMLKDHQTPTNLRRRKLLQLVAVHFDFADMARSSLGSHWRQITPAQREQFVPLYTSFMEDVYLNKLEGYSGQKIEFLNQSSDGPGYSQVSTRAVQPNGGQPIRVNYRLKQKGGEWKVYDVTVEGISITANYRNQFNRVINNEGFDSLMRKMRSKQQELAASLGNSKSSD
jgi:phospholipid transport system substrate-binding protein